MDDPSTEQRILISQARPGMVLSRPVISRDGVKLLDRDGVLSKHTIQQMALRCIKRIWIRGTEVEQAAEEENPHQLLADLDRRFERVEHLPVMSMLKTTIHDELVRRLP